MAEIKAMIAATRADRTWFPMSRPARRRLGITAC